MLLVFVLSVSNMVYYLIFAKSGLGTESYKNSTDSNVIWGCGLPKNIEKGTSDIESLQRFIERTAIFSNFSDLIILRVSLMY